MVGQTAQRGYGRHGAAEQREVVSEQDEAVPAADREVLNRRADHRHTAVAADLRSARGRLEGGDLEPPLAEGEAVAVSATADVEDAAAGLITHQAVQRVPGVLARELCPCVAGADEAVVALDDFLLGAVPVAVLGEEEFTEGVPKQWLHDRNLT